MERVPGSEALQGTRRVLQLTCDNKEAESKSKQLSLLFLLSNIYGSLVKKLAVKSDVIIENFKPGSKLLPINSM